MSKQRWPKPTIVWATFGVLCLVISTGSGFIFNSGNSGPLSIAHWYKSYVGRSSHPLVGEHFAMESRAGLFNSVSITAKADLSDTFTARASGLDANHTTNQTTAEDGAARTNLAANCTVYILTCTLESSVQVPENLHLDVKGAETHLAGRFQTINADVSSLDSSPENPVSADTVTVKTNRDTTLFFKAPPTTVTAEAGNSITIEVPDDGTPYRIETTTDSTPDSVTTFDSDANAERVIRAKAGEYGSITIRRAQTLSITLNSTTTN